MTKLRTLKYEEVVRKLRKLGFRFYRQGKGSHKLWVRDADGRVIPIPKHKGKEIKKGTLKAIINEIGISTEEFSTSDAPLKQQLNQLSRRFLQTLQIKTHQRQFRSIVGRGKHERPAEALPPVARQSRGLVNVAV